MDQQGTKLTAVIRKEKRGLYVSYCPQIGIASQGGSEEEAFENLQEAVSVYLEEVTESHHRELHLA
jgi:predicted RNase H-like HicB family nuclease